MWIDFSISSISISNSMEVTEVDTIKGCTARLRTDTSAKTVLQQKKKKWTQSRTWWKKKWETCAKKLGKA